MGKKHGMLLVIIIGGVLPVGILVADLGLYISSLDSEAITVTPSRPNVELATDNSSFTFEIDITIGTPASGFIPKAMWIRLQLCEGRNKTSVVDKISLDIAFGSRVKETVWRMTVNFSKPQKQTILGGGTITFSLQATATTKMLGVELPYPLTFRAGWWWSDFILVTS
jgi:hypothetical protein